MEIYHYEPVTKELTGQGEARRDPLEEGEILIPAYATEVAPPAFGTEEITVFDEATKIWSIMPDHRGKTCYEKATGNEVQIKELGDVPADLTELKPSLFDEWDEAQGIWVQDVARAKEAKIEICKGEAAVRINAVMPDWKVLRHKDQLELGVTTSMTQADYDTGLASRQAVRDASNTIEAEIAASADPASITDDDIRNHAAWPVEPV